MYGRSPHIITTYLQKGDVQERIRQNIQRGRLEATVTIGRAARLFDFTENQLRDWEDRGLLKPMRTTGQRQYPPAELDKLAIIKELIEEGGFTPGSIPSDVDEIWNAITSEQDRALRESGSKAEHVLIEQRVENAYNELFWRYYASHVLRLCLMLICEEIPSAPAGLVLPLENENVIPVPRPENLQEAGESLVGWLGRTHSFYTFLDQAPSFEYSSDYQILSLQEMGENVPGDRTLIVVDRRARSANLSDSIVKTIRRLLTPLYEDVKKWRSSFTQGMRDLLDAAIDFNSSHNVTEAILTGLTNMVVRLGGRTVDGWDRWRFCCILLPSNPLLPLQQRSLIVRAQSKNSPHKVGVTTISPGKYIQSLSLRAFQSGRIIYRREITSAESTIALRELEGPIRSAIAVPVGGEEGPPVASLYVVSDEPHAFSKDDQRVLRMMGRIVEELLLTYHASYHITQDLSKLIMTPGVVDPLFGAFFSENEFVEDIEALLVDIKARMDEREKFRSNDKTLVIDQDAQFGTEQPTEEVLSFISIDIDDQSYLASKYGNAMTRNLSRTIGLQVKEMLQTLITKHTDCKLYHIYACRFYLLLKGIPLEQARAKAEAMRQALEGRITIEQPTPPPRPIVLQDVTIRLGVLSYTYKKLEENLVSDNPVDIVAEVRAKIARALDIALNMGKDEGGNVVISWDPDIGGFLRWSP